MADDLGFGDLGCCNFGATRTPAIDSMAADGTMLTQHYAASPICAPARAAFLTGRYPQRSGVIDTFSHRGSDRISLRERTLGDLLGEAGYVTGLVGKWHSGALGLDYHPNHRGFAEFVGFRGAVQDYWDWNLERSGVPFPADGRYLTDVLSDEAVQFVRRHRHERSSSPSPTPPRTDRSRRRPTRSERRRRGTPDRAGDDRGDGRAHGRRYRHAARRAGPLAPARRHPRHLHQRQRAVDAGGIDRGDHGSLQPRTRRRQGARPRGRDPRADDRALAGGDQRVAAPTTRSPTSATGCRRCSPPPTTPPPASARRRRRPPPPAAWRRGGADPRGSGNGRATSRRRSPTQPRATATGSCATRPSPSSSTSSPAILSRSVASPPTRTPTDRRRGSSCPTRTLVRQPAQLFDLSVDPGEQFDVAARHPQRVARMEEQFAAWYASVEAERQSLPEAL